MPGLECIPATEFEEAGTTGQLTDRSHMLTAAAGYRKVHRQLSELRGSRPWRFRLRPRAGVALTPGRPSRETGFTDIFVYRDGRRPCVAGHESRFPHAGQ
jgi:hypothetical protein